MAEEILRCRLCGSSYFENGRCMYCEPTYYCKRCEEEYDTCAVSDCNEPCCVNCGSLLEVR